MKPRQELVELIDAYAAAQVSGNAKLSKLASAALSEWLSRHDIVAPVNVPEELKDQILGQTTLEDKRPKP